jgi:probable F420-dependent oxidoreductase
MSPTDMVDCVKLAEDLGYESAWVAEGHGGDQFSTLTACAVATERILLGTSISSVYVRSAPTLAMAAACVDHFSNKRFILGLGSSHKVQVEGEHGLPYSRPITHVKETTEVIRALLREGTVSYHGSTVDIERFDLWFEPIRPEIPVYFAAVFGPMLEVCGEMAQGSILVWSTLENARRAAEQIAVGARRAGRSPEEVDVACMLPCSVGRNADEARDPIRGIVATYAGFFPRYKRLMGESGFADDVEVIRQAWVSEGLEAATRAVPNDLVDAVALTGTPEECRRKIEEYRQNGITLPIIFPAGGGISPEGRGMTVKEATQESIRACAPSG